MDRVPERAMRWWQRLDDQGRRRASWLALCVVVYIVHYLFYCIPQPYFIEDAGISFAYARNLVEGEGLVTYAGGERVEGYSNALWTFLVAALYALGLPMWTSSKILGAVFGALTLPLAWDLARRMRPGKADDAALLVPLMLALTPPFVIWNTSGLENSLFCLLLAGGSWRLLREDEDHSLRPLSAFLFFLLTMTRPEGLMYASIALFARALYAVADRRFLPVLTWLGVFIVPFLAYNAWRLWYFAWEFPNTYYAKLGTEKAFQPYTWNKKGWLYITNYLKNHGIVYALPLLFFALTGTASTWRRRVGVACLLLLSLMVFWTGKWPLGRLLEEPDLWRGVTRDWMKARTWSIAGVAGLLGVVTLTWEGWRARGLLWALCASGVFFALYAGGDWMDEFRWFNIVSVSLFPLLALGLAELLDFVLPRRRHIPVPARLRHRFLARGVPVRAIILALVFVPFAINEVYRSSRFLLSPETSVRDIHRRVRYMTWVQRRLDLDHVTLLDVDMGAHVYYSGWDIVDIAGLVDVPMGHHQDFNKKFVEEYVFQERKPQFAHVHAGWAKASRIPQLKPFKEGYIEIPGYPIGGKKLHVGNHVRKDTFIFPFEGEPAGAIRFQAGIQLLSFELPAPQVAPGGQVHLRTLWRAVAPDGEGKRESGFRALVWLDDGQGHRAVTALSPGYDWYKPTEWKENEAVAGYFWVQVPEDLPTGTYSMGLVLLDEATGAVIPPETAPEGAAAYLPGELILSRDVRIVSPDDARKHADDDRLAALEAADKGDCEAAWPRWKDATRHLSRNTIWQDKHRGAVKNAIAECYVRRAGSAASRDDQVEALRQARFWDHHASGLADLARPLAQALDAEGDAAFEAEDWETAYRAYAAALSIDPRLSWTRRKAEEARDKRLKITRPGGPKAPPPHRDPPPPRDPSKAKVPGPPRPAAPPKPADAEEPAEGEPAEGEPAEGEPAAPPPARKAKVPDDI